ncbi:acyl--CoA ligase [Barrientosiimonas marina]|uniref:Acyl-CoA synthetase MbcS n=1 Tax=Lentibacillus kimchii TaxID=1542911 RepID=A0ABW2UTD8_9BACI
MQASDLIAPQTYNLTSEIEQYTTDANRIAIKWRSEQGASENLTYVDLFKRANQLANALQEQELGKGDRVLIMLPRMTEAYVTYLGCLKAGLVVVPSSEMLRAKDLSYRINHGEVKAAIVHAPLIGEIDSIQEDTPTLAVKIIVDGEAQGWLPERSLTDKASEAFTTVSTHRDDMALLEYTSGTTGQPKGVVHTHAWAYAHLRTTAKSWLNIEEGDTVWATAGPGWAKWVWSPFMATLGSGATGFVYSGKFEPASYLSMIQEYGINVLCCTPTEYRLMAKIDHLDHYHLSTLKNAVSAGEPLNREVIDTFCQYFDIDVRDGYGQTESTLLICNQRDMPLQPGSMGKPTPGNFVDILTEDGEVAPVGEVGDIGVHKDTQALFKEYFKEPERTNAAYRGDYFLTGDRAKKDQDGLFWFEGRSDDIIVSSGYTIGPFEVEDALVKHPSVKESAVVASPDPNRGHVVKAFIILKDPEEAKDASLVKQLQDHVKSLTAPYKYPRKIEFIDDLPKTTSGKIRRIELREKEDRMAAK